MKRAVAIGIAAAAILTAGLVVYVGRQRPLVVGFNDLSIVKLDAIVANPEVALDFAYVRDQPSETIRAVKRQLTAAKGWRPTIEPKGDSAYFENGIRGKGGTAVYIIQLRPKDHGGANSLVITERLPTPLEKAWLAFSVHILRRDPRKE